MKILNNKAANNLKNAIAHTETSSKNIRYVS
jgi:hypothetical protein